MNFTDDATKISRDPNYWRFETKARGINPNVKAGIRELKELAPNLFRDYFPKVYDHTEGFTDWRWPHYAQAYHVLSNSIYPDYYEEFEAARNMLVFTILWRQFGLGHFFVTQDIFTACLHTKPPTDFAFEEFQMPFEAMTFSLPSGALQWRGDDVEYIGIARMKKGTLKVNFPMYGKINVPDLDINISQDRFLVVTTIRGKGVFMAASMALEALRTILSVGGAGLMEEVSPHATRATPKDADFIAELLKIALNLILAMEVEPELVERERFLTVSKKDRKREVWTPNVIGRKYRIQYLEGGAAKGTHASPRAHWRSGHWRRQGKGKRIPVACLCGHTEKLHLEGETCLDATCPCFKYRQVGGGYTEYEKIWIKPVYVGLKVTANAL